MICLEVWRNISLLRFKLIFFLKSMKPYLTSAIAILICSVPLMLGYKFNYGTSSRDSSVVEEALISYHFEYAMVASVTVSTTNIVEFLLELFEAIIGRRFVTKHKFYISRDVFFALVIPVAVLLLFVVPYKTVEALPLIFHGQKIFFVQSFLYYMYIYGKPVWKKSETLIVAILLTVGEIIECYSPFFGIENTVILSICSIILHAIATIGFIALSFKWFAFLRQKVIKGKALTESEYCSNIYLAAFLVALLALWLINIIKWYKSWVEVDTLYLCWNMYSAVLLMVIISVAHLRETRIELNLTKDALATRIKLGEYLDHAVRGPISIAILGSRLLYDDMIQMGDNITRIETIVNIRDNCNCITTILDDLLSYDKYEKSRDAPELQMKQAWRFVQETVRPFLTKNNVDGVEVSLDTSVEEVDELENTCLHIDKKAMTRVIRDIISNARKFTPVDGRVIVKAKKVQLDKFSHLPIVGQDSGYYRHHNNDFLQIEVIDCGPGLSPDKQAKMFREFNTSGATGESKKDQSSGLSLWLAAGIVEMHGGSIRANSAGEGKGCTFTIELPLIPIEEVIELSMDSTVGISPSIRQVVASSSNKLKLNKIGSSSNNQVEVLHMLNQSNDNDVENQSDFKDVLLYAVDEENGHPETRSKTGSLIKDAVTGSDAVVSSKLFVLPRITNNIFNNDINSNNSSNKNSIKNSNSSNKNNSIKNGSINSSNNNKNNSIELSDENDKEKIATAAVTSLADNPDTVTDFNDDTEILYYHDEDQKKSKNAGDGRNVPPVVVLLIGWEGREDLIKDHRVVYQHSTCDSSNVRRVVIESLEMKREKTFDIIILNCETDKEVDGMIITKTLREAGYQGLVLVSLADNLLKTFRQRFLFQGADRVISNRRVRNCTDFIVSELLPLSTQRTPYQANDYQRSSEGNRSPDDLV